MDLLQQIAVIALLTMVAYLIMVNVFKTYALKSDGKVTDYIEKPQVKKPQVEKQSHMELISNKLPIEEGLNLAMGTHARTTVGGPVGEGASNTTTLSVYNENTVGVLPQNHDLFEKSADFGSDVTNINQFYRNNPELFHKQSQSGVTHVPNPTDWDVQAKAMFLIKENEASGPVQAFNYEQGPNTPLL